MCGVITNCGRCAVRADSVHVRHASVEVQVHCVNVVNGVVLGELLVVVRVVPILLVMLWFVAHLVVIAFHRSHCFHVGLPQPFFCIWRYSGNTSVTMSQKSIHAHSSIQRHDLRLSTTVGY